MYGLSHQIFLSAQEQYVRRAIAARNSNCWYCLQKCDIDVTCHRRDLWSFPPRGRIDLVRSGRAFTRETVTRVTSRRAGNLFLTYQFFREPRSNSTRRTRGLRVKVVLVLATGPLLSASSVSQMFTARRPLPDTKSSYRGSAHRSLI